VTGRPSKNHKRANNQQGGLSMVNHTKAFGALAGIAALAAMALPGNAVAQGYPDRPITIVVSASVGGSIDAMTRALAPYWEKTLGQKINVENKGGAGGITGVRYFLDQPDDGYTIMVCTEAHYEATVVKTGTVKPSDIEVINMQQYTPTTWFVLDSARWKTLEDLFAEAKEKPDTISYGSPTTGNSLISAGVVENAWKMDLRFIPQEGGSETDTALLGGHIDVKIGTAGDITEVEGMRALAVAAPKRVKLLPDTPTFNEVADKLGLTPKMPSIGTGRLIAVRSSLKEQHPEIFQKLVDSYKEAFNNPEYQKLLESNGQAASTEFNEPAAANEQFQQLVDDSIKYKAEYLPKQ
jgi:putative tricarboxylic transport membrane protein